MANEKLTEKTAKAHAKQLAMNTFEMRMKVCMNSRLPLATVIDTFEMTNSEKARFLNAATMRKKGKLPKVNPWQKGA